MQISSTPWHDMHTEINIRLTGTIGKRKDLPEMDQRDLTRSGKAIEKKFGLFSPPWTPGLRPSRNGSTGLDKIREGHRKEIRTIQPTLDTWTA
ncbi:hypothetical protein HGM15179_012520 [Zosterops borbonicus]|uniref:Uncharacterized protein n=1 Tax=Zosterops borbonicus TaxID=364589 RepID=A0A8K1GAP8_9PASS|nr:hypothetical protein HGM15179_012520 [Zosterops borbonicus]